MVELIIENIATWSSAQIPKTNGGRGRGRGSNGQSFHGIKKLRELILELAVRGKLAPQDPNDEPASVLLEKIAKEKALLIKEKKINIQKTLLEIGEDEKPFELPRGWAWQRLGELGNTQTGGTPSKTDESFFGNDIPFIKPGDIYPTHVDYLNEGLSFAGQQALGRIAQKGSILMVCIGTIGKCNSIDRDCCFNQQINSLSPYVDLTNFLLVALRANYFQSIAWAKSSSTTIAILNKGKWADIVVPIAPLAEQRRIVSKVGELMALCDKLEQQQTGSNDTHQTLVETLLATLTTIADSAAFAQGWQRIANRFDTLFTTEESIDQLKQTILQLAVMGKLILQDPHDEPASVLLEEIAQEKAQLIKGGKIKKQPPLSKIGANEKPFEIPPGWEWLRLGEVVQIRGGKRVSNGYKLSTTPTPYVYIRVSDMKNGSIDDSDLHYIDEEMHSKIKQYIIRKNDIYMTIVGATIGKCGIIPDKFDGMNLTENAARLIMNGSVERLFLHKCLESEFCQRQFIDKTKQVGVQKMALARLASTIIALPPLAEQHRIVAKVDELMALCEALKKRLRDAKTTQIHLADVIVEQAVA